jgi:hypothetical protein
VWAPAGIGGGFAPASRRTTQEFHLDDDLGDSRPSAPGYGGTIASGTFRTAGAIWSARGAPVRVSLYADAPARIELVVFRPDPAGRKSRTHGRRTRTGRADGTAPLVLDFTAREEGYHQLAARLAAGTAPVRGYVKVEYQAPRVSDKF